MKKLITTAIAMVVLTAGLSGCSMSNRDARTLTVAGLGAAVGYGLSGGDAGATLGGAVVGGFLGNQSRGYRDYRY